MPSFLLHDMRQFAGGRAAAIVTTRYYRTCTAYRQYYLFTVVQKISLEKIRKDAVVAESERNLVSKHQVQPECEELADWRGTGWPTRLARPNSQERTGNGKFSYFRLR